MQNPPSANLSQTPNSTIPPPLFKPVAKTASKGKFIPPPNDSPPPVLKVQLKPMNKTQLPEVLLPPQHQTYHVKSAFTSTAFRCEEPKNFKPPQTQISDSLSVPVIPTIPVDKQQKESMKQNANLEPDSSSSEVDNKVETLESSSATPQIDSSDSKISQTQPNSSSTNAAPSSNSPTVHQPISIPAQDKLEIEDNSDSDSSQDFPSKSSVHQSSGMVSSDAPAPDSMEVSCDIINGFFSTPSRTTKDQACIAFKHVLHHLKPFYYFHSISMKVRIILFLIQEPDVDIQYPSSMWAILGSMLLDFVPTSNKTTTLNAVASTSAYDLDAQTMPFLWRQQYAFEETAFNSNDYLLKFINEFLETVEGPQKWKKFNLFVTNIVKFYEEQYNVFPGMPQIGAYSMRALHELYLSKSPLFPRPLVNEQFISQVSKLRACDGNVLMIKDKFMPEGALAKRIGGYKDVYQHTVQEFNKLAFDYLPEDLFVTIGNMHETLFEELAIIQYHRKKKDKQTLAQFRPLVQVGQEDIMPIIILILVLADVPNLPEIVDFFNDYSMDIEVNSKTGLYMANIATAFGAIMNWSFDENAK